MREIHQGLPYKDFVRPASGIIDVTVCAKSGLLKTAACNQGEVVLPFLAGTQPELYCTVHGNTGSIEMNLERLRFDTVLIDDTEILQGLTMPALPPEFMMELNSGGSSNRNTQAGSGTSSSAANSRVSGGMPLTGRTSSSSRNQPVTGNPFLDGAPPLTDGTPSGEGPVYIPENSTGGEAAGGGLELPAYNPLLD
jgi:penicillin-binding protein 1A